MTSYLVSQCYSFNPLSTKQIPKTRPVIDPTRFRVLNHQPKKPVWALNVSVPLKTIAIEGNKNNREMRNGVNGVDSFDPGSPRPFGLADIRAVISKHCWVKDTWRSMSYVVRDVAIAVALAALATYVNSWVFWHFYWFAQGTMFWALFVLGHDCGNGSFANDAKLNSVAGHFLHSSILVPYHGWRISHRTHHQNHGHVENDESWHPVKLVITSKYSHTFNQHAKSRRNFLNNIIYNNYQSSSGNTHSLNVTSATSEDNSSSVPPETLPNLDTQTKEKPASQVPKKTPLTAREKLRAARVLSRYNDSKPSSKMGLGSKVLDALRESDGGKKRSGLPQAPTNLFDDSKRGMPKPGLTFDFPGGADLFYIVLSVVFISTVMFTTTFVVWKLGAIHFNEY